MFGWILNFFQSAREDIHEAVNAKTKSDADLEAVTNRLRHEHQHRTARKVEEREQAEEQAATEQQSSFEKAVAEERQRAAAEQSDLYDRRDSEQSGIYDRRDAEEKRIFEQSQQEINRPPPDFEAQSMAAEKVKAPSPKGPDYDIQID